MVSKRWSLVCCAWVRSWVKAWKISVGRRPCRVVSQFLPFPESTPDIKGPGELKKQKSLNGCCLSFTRIERSLVTNPFTNLMLDVPSFSFFSLFFFWIFNIVDPCTSHDELLAVLCLLQTIYVFIEPYDRSWSLFFDAPKKLIFYSTFYPVILD